MRIALPFILAIGLVACGSQAPRVALPNPDQYAVQFHAVDYDVSQGGRTFAAEGATYEIQLSPAARGLRVEGTRILGAPETLDPITVTVLARDAAGRSASDEFIINVSINGAPRPTGAHDDVLVKVGEPVSLELEGAGKFEDPENDALTHQFSVRGAPGIAVDGTRIVGRFNKVGAVEVSVTATDAFGASGTLKFLLAAPAPQPRGVPALPAKPYKYAIAREDLPSAFHDAAKTFDTERLPNVTTDAGATLGRVLFHDPRLSITNTLACVTCHQQKHGFASDRRFDSGVLGVALTRQVMPLANVRYNKLHAWFSDMRATTLRDTVRMAMQNPEEMGIHPALLEEKLRATSFYPPLFETAFGSPGIDEERAVSALAQYLQAMVSYRARVDRAEPSAQEKRGREIFQGAARVKCADCHDAHTGSLLWGANNGLDATPADPRDRGPLPYHGVAVGVFRAASLRNLALTAPYMHDGRFKTLREVIDHYDHGIQPSATLHERLRDADGKPLRMELSEADKQALEAFLRTFTDAAMTADPKFSNPF